MMERSKASFVLALAAALALIASGCSAINDFGKFIFGGSDAGPPDSGQQDGGVDAGPDAGNDRDAGRDAGEEPDAGPGRSGSTSVVQTSGGAVIRTPEYRLRVSVGAPQPVGSSRTATHRVRVGPVTR